MAEPVAELLRRSLEHLAAEVPGSYQYLRTELGALVVEVDVDGEVFSVRGGVRLAVADGGASDAGARITTSRCAVLDVLDAGLALGDAVSAGRVDVHGSLDDVLRAHDALLAYVHGAVRAPSVPGLVDGLRGEGGSR
jgi:hypothetical protein